MEILYGLPEEFIVENSVKKENTINNFLEILFVPVIFIIGLIGYILFKKKNSNKKKELNIILSILFVILTVLIIYIVYNYLNNNI